MQFSEEHSSWKRWVLTLVGAATALKILLFASYLSTDFDVHRNWLAITYHLPISQWYFEHTSEWTLDYPPFFAYFEWVLSHISIYVLGKDSALNDLLPISAEPIRNQTAVYFQRSTVVITDIVYILALLHFFKTKRNQNYMQWVPLFGVLLFLPGLLMVDHIHFQYNGILMGILVLSISFIVQGEDLKGAILFAIALNFKHLFLYVAPVYFIYLLRNYCFQSYQTVGTSKKTDKPTKGFLESFSLMHLVLLGSAVTVIFGLSFGPFAVMGQMPQVISRLFPFGRGLCHAYWAPNFWALYNIADKALLYGVKASGLPIGLYKVGAMTGGLVGETDITHVILPVIKPAYTMALILAFLLPMMVQLWRHPTKQMFIACTVNSAMTFYMFGWHVHEKAILTAIIPFWLLAFESIELAKMVFFLSTVGHYSLFPLLFETKELPTKNLLLVAHVLASYVVLNTYYKEKKQIFTLSFLEKSYLYGLILLELFANIIHPLYLNEKLPFLALMITSVYCAIGITYLYIRLYAKILRMK